LPLLVFLQPPKHLSSRPKHDGFMSCVVERSPYWLLLLPLPLPLPLLLLLLLLLFFTSITKNLVILERSEGPLYSLLHLLLSLPLLLHLHLH